MPSFYDILMKVRKQQPDRVMRDRTELSSGYGAGVETVPKSNWAPPIYPDYEIPPDITPRDVIMQDILNQLLPGAFTKKNRFYNHYMDDNITPKQFIDRQARTDSQLEMKAPDLRFFKALQAGDMLDNTFGKSRNGRDPVERLYNAIERGAAVTPDKRKAF